MRTLLAALVVLGVVSACGDGGVDAPILEVVVGEDDQALYVRLDAGSTEGDVSVEESADEVRLAGSAAADCRPPGGLCLGADAQVRLEAPLGGRVLIDATTDTEITGISRCIGREGEGLADICADLAADT